MADEPARGQRRYTLEEAAAEIRSTASLLEQRIEAGFLELDADGRADEEAFLRMLMLDRLHTAETHAKGAYSQCVHGFHHPSWAPFRRWLLFSSRHPLAAAGCARRLTLARTAAALLVGRTGSLIALGLRRLLADERGSAGLQQ